MGTFKRTFLFTSVFVFSVALVSGAAIAHDDSEYKSAHVIAFKDVLESHPFNTTITTRKDF